MKKAAQKSAVLFLAAMLIMATGGFSIYHHFCRCAGEGLTTIILEPNCDHQETAGDLPAVCCSVDEPSGCCTNEDAENHSDACNGDDCCQTSSQFLKIVDTYTVSLDKLSLKFIVSFIQVLTSTTLLAEPQVINLQNPHYTDTSPPLYGRELVNHFHQQKIAPAHMV
jgi:hypothetical protein